MRFGCFLYLTLLVFESAAVGQNNATGSLVEFENLERQFLINLCLSLILFDEVFRSSEAFNAVFQLDDITLFRLLNDSTFMNRTYCKDGFKYIPRIFLGLLVSKAETTIFFAIVRYYLISL